MIGYIIQNVKNKFLIEFNTMFNKISGRLSSLSKKLNVITLEKVYEQMGLSENWYLIKKI